MLILFVMTQTLNIFVMINGIFVLDIIPNRMTKVVILLYFVRLLQTRLHISSGVASKAHELIELQ